MRLLRDVQRHLPLRVREALFRRMRQELDASLDEDGRAARQALRDQFGRGHWGAMGAGAGRGASGGVAGDGLGVGAKALGWALLPLKLGALLSPELLA